jgi:hypothetical protein
MPTSIIVALAGAVAANFLVGIEVTAILAYAAGALVSGYVAGALYKPKKASAQDTRPTTLTIRQAVAPWQVIYGQMRVGGIITYMEVSSYGGASNNILNIVITLAGHAVDSIGEIWFNDEIVPLDGAYPNGGGNVASGKYAGYATVQKSLGDEAGQPWAELRDIFSAGLWTDAHRQSGRAKLYVRLVFSNDVFVNGVPNISAVVKGKKVYDPRSALTVWSANAALCIADYLVDAKLGLGCVYANEIDNASLVAAANVCDEDVGLLAGGTEKRYTCNGAFTVDAAPREVLGRLNTAYGGPTRFLAGRWTFAPAAYATPTVTLTVDDLRGPVHIVPRLSRRDVANAVKGVFVSPGNNWQPSEFPAVTNNTYYVEDQSERIWMDIDLPFTSSSPTAQRIAKIELERIRQQIVLELPCKLTMYQLQPGDTVMVTLARYGYSAKVFEVAGMKLVFEPDENGVFRLGVDLVLRETAAAVFDWNSGMETIDDPAPDSNLPDPFAQLDLAIGTPVSGTAELFIAGDGTVISRIRLPFTPPLNPFVSAYQAQFRVTGAPSWQDAPAALAGATSAYYYPVSDGVSYDMRLRAITSLGNAGAWAAANAHTVIGKTALPSNVGTLSFTDPFLSWLALTDQDLRGYIVRYQVGANTDWASALPAHKAGFITETRFDTGDIVGGSTTLLVKSVDTSGNQASAPSTLLVDLRPATPTSFLFSRQADGTREFSWATTTPPDDFDGVHIRYFLGTTSDWSAMTPLHNGLLKASPFENNQLAAGTYTFAAKNVDRAGNESAAAIFITTVTIGDPRVAGAVEDLKEEPTWTGTKTDCHVDVATGWLVADGTATWTTLPATWTGWTAWNATPKSPIVYVRQIDIGVKLKFTPLVTVLADGSQVIEEQHSDDDISYSSYTVVGPQLDARYIRVRVTITGAYPKIKTERIVLSAAPTVEIIEDQNSASLTGAHHIAAGDIRLPIVKVYASIKKVDVTLQSVGGGWSWELIDKDTSVGPRVKIYNASNVLAEAVFDATVTGI